MKHKGQQLLTCPAFLFLTVLFVLMPIPGKAQQFTGTIQGVVHDSTGAVVVSAEVSIVNIVTNETRNTVTNSTGIYVMPQLKPSLYRVVIKKTGFKVSTFDQIKLDVQQIREVDAILEVGQASETVSVTASGAATIDTVSSTVSQTIENKRIVDLPLNGRNPFSLATMSPGVTPAPGSSPFISGGRNATSEVTIDGISNVNAENNVSILDLNYTPSVDAVQEFSVQTNAVSAEFGRLGGGVINLVTKGGTSQFHATAFEFMRNSVLDANNFFSNRAGREKGSFKRNQFGGNIGGPIKKEKTFFFVNYEGLRLGSASVQSFTVPLPEWRRGDFTGLRNAQGQAIQLYNPFHYNQNAAGRFIREPFKCDAAGNALPIGPDRRQGDGTPCNKIPTGLMNPLAINLMQYWPLPNATPSNEFTQQNNYVAQGTNVNNANQIDSRVDHNFSANWRSFVRYSVLFKNANRPFNHFGNDATPANAGPVDSTAKSLSVDNVYTVNPTLFLNVRYGLNRRTAKRSPFSSGFDFTQLGFPASLRDVAKLQALEFPRFDINGLASLGQENFNDLVIAPTTHSFNANVTKTLSRHTLKFGMDYRKLMLNFLQLSQPSGQYSFTPLWTQEDTGSARSTAGFGLASFLLGIPNGGQISHDPTPASASSYWGFYIQDDFKFSPKLTLNFGLRYDRDVPRTERFDRLSYFDFDAVSPIAGQVPANPYFNPADLRGAVKFVDGDNRRQTPTDGNNFGPRIGFAYNLTNKTVMRAAYGIYYSPSGMQAAGHTGTAGMLGYRTNTQMVVSSNGRDPLTFIDNPFPNGFNLPPGTSQGGSTNLGLGMGEGVILDYRSPYIQQWNFNVQRELPGNVVFEAAYIGSKGTRLLAGESGVVLSQVPEQYLSLGNLLTNSQVDNPFFNVITNPTSALRFQRVNLNRALRPYPQYDGVNAFRVPYGFSIYHGGTLRADKRFSNGASFLMAYTWSKLIDDVSTTVNFLGQASTRQNVYDRKSERAIGSQDISHRFVTSFVYELPFGKGKLFGRNSSSILNRVISGWQFNGIATFQSGLPLIITQGANQVGLFNPTQRPTWNGQDANLNGSTDEKLRRWFDTGAFSITAPFTWGTTPRVMPNLRGDGIKNFDLSFFKNNYFREGRWNAQFRVELFNAFNRVRFGNPGIQVDGGGFGEVGGTANDPRQIQVALKLTF